MEFSDSKNTNIVTLMSSDGKVFELDEVVASQSHIIKKVMEDLSTNTPVPLPLVSSDILEKVIQYCRYHVLHDANPNPRRDMVFLETLDDHETLLRLVLDRAMEFLQNLLDLLCETIANMIRGKNQQQIRQILNIHDEQDDCTSQQ